MHFSISDIPNKWVRHAIKYSKAENHTEELNPSTIFAIHLQNDETVIKLDKEKIYPSKLGNFFYSTDPLSEKRNSSDVEYKLVCYYSFPHAFNETNELYADSIYPNLCTHINVGMVWIKNNRLDIDDTQQAMFEQIKILKRKNPNLKILFWVGGADSPGFSEMVKNHANRKQFIQSLKEALTKYRLDGLDLDWEFPSAHNRERQHFTQLLHEIRLEYEREHRTYLLSVAVAAVEGIAFYAYDIGKINEYADYVNIMSYDYHFYTRSSPFTGIVLLYLGYLIDFIEHK